MPSTIGDQLLSPRVRERIRDLVHAIAGKQLWKNLSLLSLPFGLLVLHAWRTGRLSRLLRPIRRRKDVSEPSLITKHSSFESFTPASGHAYPSIRVFYHPHLQAAKLPGDLPLFVFMHGLGGSVTQFAPLLTSLVNIGPCLAIDLPGCGLSEFKPDEASAYSTVAFAELLCTAIESYRNKANNQQVVIIGHSMGCSIAALLASSTSPLQSRLKTGYIISLIALCPRSSPFTYHEAQAVKRLRWIPVPLFDLVRLIDRRGGLESASITRMVGEGADTGTRKLQRKFNDQSRSAVFLRFALGMLTTAADPSGALPGKEVWSGIKVPLFLVAGESDQVTSPKEVEQIAEWLTEGTEALHQRAPASVAAGEGDQRARERTQDSPVALEAEGSWTKVEYSSETVPTTAGDLESAQYLLAGSGKGPVSKRIAGADDHSSTVKEEQKHTNHAFALKTTVFPAPAAHGLMYATSTVRILSGLIETFLAHHVDERLALGWQLQHMTTSGKWDVKNLKKWRNIDECSEPIAGVFRAMKTMREVDDVHNPHEFVRRFGCKALPDGVAIVVDISHESPVYDPKGLEEGGVEYHKFPTVSKLPPTADEVEHFVSLIDLLRTSPRLQPTNGTEGGQYGKVHPVIGVHCHYGFNRTGFFIVCYLVERLHYRVQDAIEEFAAKRKPGIKHEHFVNELYVRYAAKMERRGTIVG
ncbi:hypothetical protein LTS02_008452 [Friedmanniomyces endolithicus]|nr:hypothetical protein LTR75_009460 [Friedmanniomyces endolithicus]KAK0830182.1 hypothetical protein LTR03_015932 [Friedmanniomyces endolithicus]KAK0860439.1 hypothetical protein LTS02_008452 [Friedmanniomyces endolithicus]KAK0869844.1 hypothetical protein LTR87_013552 [Friedmanniomyces endolithicus]